jgi:hypothetical protein
MYEVKSNDKDNKEEDNIGNTEDNWNFGNRCR